MAGFSVLLKERRSVPSVVLTKARTISAGLLRMLKDLMKNEYHASLTYTAQGEILEAAGHKALAQKFMQEGAEESAHGQILIKRIVFFGEDPSCGDIATPYTKGGPKEFLLHSLGKEEEALDKYNKAIAQAKGDKDFATAVILGKILLDEDGHYDWLTGELDRIKAIGLKLYLAEKGGEEEAEEKDQQAKGSE